jgi:hypothetical protein
MDPESPASNDEPLSITQVDRDSIFLMFASVEIGRALDALMEADRLSAVDVQIAPGLRRQEWLDVFNAIRLALHFAASVSRIFWPPRSAGESRGARLRSLVGLSDDHYLKSRSLRDHMEHLDERLDTWTEVSPRSFTWVEMNLKPDIPSGTREAILASTPIVYFEDKREISIIGNTFSLEELRGALEDVRRRIQQASHWSLDQTV